MWFANQLPPRLHKEKGENTIIPYGVDHTVDHTVDFHYKNQKPLTRNIDITKNWTLENCKGIYTVISEQPYAPRYAGDALKIFQARIKSNDINVTASAFHGSNIYQGMYCLDIEPGESVDILYGMAAITKYRTMMFFEKGHNSDHGTVFVDPKVKNIFPSFYAQLVSNVTLTYKNLTVNSKDYANEPWVPYEYVELLDDTLLTLPENGVRRFVDLENNLVYPAIPYTIYTWFTSTDATKWLSFQYTLKKANRYKLYVSSLGTSWRYPGYSLQDIVPPFYLQILKGTSHGTSWNYGAQAGVTYGILYNAGWEYTYGTKYSRLEGKYSRGYQLTINPAELFKPGPIDKNQLYTKNDNIYNIPVFMATESCSYHWATNDVIDLDDHTKYSASVWGCRYLKLISPIDYKNAQFDTSYVDDVHNQWVCPMIPPASRPLYMYYGKYYTPQKVEYEGAEYINSNAQPAADDTLYVHALLGTMWFNPHTLTHQIYYGYNNILRSALIHTFGSMIDTLDQDNKRIGSLIGYYTFIFNTADNEHTGCMFTDSYNPPDTDLKDKLWWVSANSLCTVYGYNSLEYFESVVTNSNDLMYLQDIAGEMEITPSNSYIYNDVKWGVITDVPEWVTILLKERGWDI